MSQSKELFVVHNSVAGYAREDATNSNVIACLSDEKKAKMLAVVAHGKVQKIVVDEIPQGYLKMAQELGFKF